MPTRRVLRAVHRVLHRPVTKVEKQPHHHRRKKARNDLPKSRIRISIRGGAEFGASDGRRREALSVVVNSNSSSNNNNNNNNNKRTNKKRFSLRRRKRDRKQECSSSAKESFGSRWGWFASKPMQFARDSDRTTDEDDNRTLAATSAASSPSSAGLSPAGDESRVVMATKGRNNELPHPATPQSKQVAAQQHKHHDQDGLSSILSMSTSSSCASSWEGGFGYDWDEATIDTPIEIYLIPHNDLCRYRKPGDGSFSLSSTTSEWVEETVVEGEHSIWEEITVSDGGTYANFDDDTLSEDWGEHEVDDGEVRETIFKFFETRHTGEIEFRSINGDCPDSLLDNAWEASTAGSQMGETDSVEDLLQGGRRFTARLWDEQTAQSDDCIEFRNTHPTPDKLCKPDKLLGPCRSFDQCSATTRTTDPSFSEREIELSGRRDCSLSSEGRRARTTDVHTLAPETHVVIALVPESESVEASLIPREPILVSQNIACAEQPILSPLTSETGENTETSAPTFAGEEKLRLPQEHDHQLESLHSPEHECARTEFQTLIGEIEGDVHPHKEVQVEKAIDPRTARTEFRTLISESEGEVLRVREEVCEELFEVVVQRSDPEVVNTKFRVKAAHHDDSDDEHHQVPDVHTFAAVSLTLVDECIHPSAISKSLEQAWSILEPGGTLFLCHVQRHRKYGVEEPQAIAPFAPSHIQEHLERAEFKVKNAIHEMETHFIMRRQGLPDFSQQRDRVQHWTARKPL